MGITGSSQCAENEGGLYTRPPRESQKKSSVRDIPWRGWERDFGRLRGDLAKIARDLREMARDLREMARDLRKMARDLRKMGRDLRKMAADRSRSRGEPARFARKA
jgi:hypothetical protein